MSKTAELWEKVLSSSDSKKGKLLKKLQNHLWDYGDHDASQAIGQELRDFLKERGEMFDWLHNSWIVALRYNSNGNSESALEVLRETVPVAIEADDHFNASYLLNLQGQIQKDVGLLESAAHSFNLAIDEFEQDGNSTMAGETHFQLGYIYKQLGRPGDAKYQYFLANEAFIAAKLPARTVDVRLEISDLMLELSECDSAIPVLSDALQVARFLDSKLAEQKVLRRLGVAHSLHGDIPLAESLLRTAAGMKDDSLQAEEAARALECLAQHNQRIGEFEKATKQFKQLDPVKQAFGLSIKDNK